MGGVMARVRRPPRGPGRSARDGSPRPGILMGKALGVTAASFLNAVVTNTRWSSLFLQWAQPGTAGWGGCEAEAGAGPGTLPWEAA